MFNSAANTYVCSGFSPDGYKEYGQDFLETFHKFWPSSVKLAVYTELPVQVPRGICRSLGECQGVEKFIDANQGIPAHTGREPNEFWRDKHRRGGYNFRYDCVRFCRQLFIPEHAATLIPDGNILAWFDADVITYKEVPDNFIQGILGDHDMVYMGRRHGDPELGFWAVRLSTLTRVFLFNLAESYRSGRVFQMRETHSGHVFRRCLPFLSTAKVKNLSFGFDGHVWFETVLGDYTDHLKGSMRKALGRSEERVA